jgi:hypothetical protein
LNSLFLLIGAILLAGGLGGGWFCYSRTDPDKVQEASYELGHSLIPTESIWLLGAIAGLISMVSGMVLIFIALVDLKTITPWITWFKDVFG